MATRRLVNHRPSGTRSRPRIFQPHWLRAVMRRRALPIILMVAGGVFLAMAGTVLWWSKDLPDPQGISARQVVESTKIYDRTNTHLLYEIGEIRRTYIDFTAISSHLKNATLAAEDDKFYDHHGIDFAGIIRGVIVKPLSGRRVQGGSTITQQLIKNAILTPERTPQRKAKEIVLALELEQRFNKDEIFSMYLNEIPYGSQAYGVEAAAQTFFGKSAANLSLPEAAILASLPKAPTYYSPYGSHFEDLKQRQEAILQRMADLGFISADEAEGAKKEEINFAPPAESISAPHFVFYIKEQLDAEYGERVVEQGGLVVTTTLDMRLQKIAEETLVKNKEAINSRGASNAALTAVDPKTGDILAMAGSLDYFDESIDGNVNVAVRHRSPGSSIKPFVYAAAWQKGYTPDTVLVDAETDFGQGYKPQNYDGKSRGPISMRAALSNSLNVPAVQTLYLAGVRNATNLAQKMGMTSLSDPDRYGLSLVLGGGEVRLLDEVSAYSVLANDGLRHPPRGILKVVDGSEELFTTDDDDNNSRGEQVIDAELARLVTNVISDNNARAPVFGSRSPLQLGSRPVAAKTGTTQDYRDGWTMGYTPSLATGVWVGNNDNSPMHKNADGVYTAAPIWNAFMREALAGTPIEQFVAPQRTRPAHGILRGEIPEVKGKWDEDTNTLYTVDCPVALGQPTTFKEIHNILFYVNRDHPTGPPPANAHADPQFGRWEEAVNAWRAKHNEENKGKADQPRYVDSLPTPTCEAASAENLPTVRITEPGTTVLTESPVTVKAEVTSPEKIKEVRFVFDGEEIARRGPDDPHEATLSFDDGFSGRKTLVILAITENNLIGRAHRAFIINPDDAPPTVTLHTPQNGKSFKPENFPLTIKVTAADASGIDFVDILYQKNGAGGTHRVGRAADTTPAARDRYEVVWADSPGPGDYTIYAVAYDSTGNTTESARHKITIE